MTTAILKITNGTDSVDLLELREGISLTLWRQAVAQYKGSGGTFRQSSLSDGRRLVDKRFAEIRDNLQIKIGTEVGGTQEATILILHKLFALLEGASNYWVGDWNYTPVWLESRASCETNTRYAHIVTANIVDLDNVYGSLFQDTGAMSDLTLSIEHGHWCSVRPGTGTATLTSAVEAFNGRSLGNVDSAGIKEPVTSGVYFANKRNTANITHIFTWSAANGFSANLLGGPFPYNLIDDVGAAPQVNDYVAFGIDTTILDSGPFISLVFDIGVAQTGLSLTWQQNVGAGWGVVAVLDHTATAQPFDTAGVNGIFMSGLGGPVGAVNGVTGYWVRARITAIPGAFVIPTQQNRDVYSVVWPYTEIQANEIAGDISALTRIKLEVQSHDDGSVDMDTFFFNRVILGLRSLGRGSDFTAYLNAADIQNPVGLTVTVGALTAFTSSSVFITGRVAWFQAVGVSAMADRVVFTFAPALAAQFYGTYRVFCRCFPAHGIADVEFRLRIKYGVGGEEFTGSAIIPSDPLNDTVLDFGKIVIPSREIVTTSDLMTLVIAVQASAAGALDVFIHDLILIPVDEWALDTADQTNDADSTIEEGRYLDIDSLINPKTPLRSLARDVVTDEVTGIYLAIKNGPAMLHNNSQQRLWCFVMRPSAVSSDTWIADYQTAATIQIEKCQRYLGPRGTM